MRPLRATSILGLSVSTGSLFAMLMHPALADGPVPTQLNKNLKGQNETVPTLNLKINQPLGIAALNAAGQITVPVAGDASAAQVSAEAPGGTVAVPLRLHNSDRISVRDYASNGIVGGAYSATVLSAQAAGDNVVQMMPNDHIRVSHHVSAAGLPPGTVITGIGPQTSVNVHATTREQTIPDSEQSLLINQHGMATALVFASAEMVPVGAQVSGVGIATGTTVVALSFKSTTIYISQPVTQSVPTGTPITFNYASEPVYLSQKWKTAPLSGLEIGIYTQDDYTAFNSGAFWNDTIVGGKGALVYVPSGKYYLSKPVFARTITSFELGPNVSFIPGSADIDAANGTFPAYSQTSFVGTGQGANPVPTEINIAQTLYQRPIPDLQGQALLIQQNDNCSNDNGGWGCGMVGEEVKQNATPSIRRGAFWEYHGTDYLLPGQAITWVGAELEVANSSGFWGAFSGNSLNGNRVGLHVDNIVPSDPSHVANSYALDPAGDWHTMAQCDGSILDWCIAHSDGSFSNQQPMPDSGIDSKGRVFGSKFIAMLTASDTGENVGVVAATTRTAAINNNGSIGAESVNTPTLSNTTAGVASIAIEDGGRFNGPVKLAVGEPPQGGVQAVAHVATYTLRAVQGAVAINADSLHGKNAPAGVYAGTVFSLPGGVCAKRPMVTYDGDEFIVSTPGLCSELPNDGVHTLPTGMIRNQLQLTYASGGVGVPLTSPVIEPLYGIASVEIDNPGSGYNADVPPDVLGETKFDAKTGQWSGIIYTPIRLASILGTTTQAPVRINAVIQLSKLPKNCTVGQIAFVSDARNNGEVTGQGTGALAYCTSARKWIANGATLRN